MFSSSSKRTIVLVATIVLAACAINKEPLWVEIPLNSTLIQQKFGSYGVEVLAQETDQRITSLYSLVDGQPVTRTLAVVEYLNDYPPEVADVHVKVVSGGSLGQSFIDHGFDVVKETLVLMKLPSNEGLQALYDMMNLDLRAPLAYHMYVLKVRKQGEWVSYARVTEVHSPEHLKIKELAKKLEIDNYYREKHPYTKIVMRDFRSFINKRIAPLIAATGT